jgi:hypothetical protein
VATATTTNNSSSNFPRGVGQQGIGMPTNHNFGLGWFSRVANSYGFCQPTAQSVFLQHSNALPGNQQIEPAAEINDNEDEGDTQLNSKAQSNFGGNEGRDLYQSQKIKTRHRHQARRTT